MSDEQSPRPPAPVLIHLTHDLNVLASITQGLLRAGRAYGAAHNHNELGESQRVVCLSEIELADIARLAQRHGHYGLGFHRRWAQQRGAAPVWYLPRQSQLQKRLFEVVKSLAFRADPVIDHFLWEFTPFIDYPQDAATDSDTSPYDWRWEREWRVRGDLQFEPADVAIVFAPEESHGVLPEMWLWEALDADQGHLPPLVDPSWSLEQQLAVIRQGSTFATSDIDDYGQSKTEALASVDPSGEPYELIDTAPHGLTWVDDNETARREQQEEWAGWLDEMEGDDI